MVNVIEFNPYEHKPEKSVSWRAVFAGTLTVLSILLILNLIGLWIGLGTINPSEETNPLSGVGIGSIIWWVLSNLIALFAGGFVAARAGVSFTDVSGVLQGILTWALYTILSAWLLTTVVGNIISGVGSAVGGVLSTTGETVGDRVSSVIEDQAEQLNVTLEEAREEFNALLDDADREEIQEEFNIEQIFRDPRNVLENTFDAVDRDALINVLVERTDMNENEAQQAVDELLADYENLRADAEEFLAEAEETAREQAEQAADAVSSASIYLAIALILGVIAAAFGGLAGVKNLRDDYENNYFYSEENVKNV